MSFSRFDADGNLVVNYDRWKSVGDESDKWASRYKALCEHIAPGDSVVEFGCGSEAIRRFLPEGCRYQPSDLIERSSDCVRIDLIEQSPADIGGRYDVTVFAGVLEYLPDPLATIGGALAISRRVLFSYASLDAYPDLPKRIRAYGWFSHLSLDDLAQGARTRGIRLRDMGRWHKQHLFEASTQADGAADGPRGPSEVCIPD